MKKKIRQNGENNNFPPFPPPPHTHRHTSPLSPQVASLPEADIFCIYELQLPQLSTEVSTSITSAGESEQKTSMALLLHLKLCMYLSALLILM